MLCFNFLLTLEDSEKPNVRLKVSLVLFLFRNGKCKALHYVLGNIAF